MRFFYLCIVSYVLIAVFTLSLSTGFFSSQISTSEAIPSAEVKAYEVSPPVPKFTGNDNFPELSSYAILAVDLNSDTILYQKNPDTKLLPASTAKIVTALVAMDYYPLDEILTVSEFSVDGQKMRLVPGEEISVRDLIYGILIYSANDAAEVLARNYPGGRESFVASMNLKIQEMGLVNTHFENPTGFDGNYQSITAGDLAEIAKIAMQDPFFREVVGTREITVGSLDGNYIHRLTNINKLVGEVEGVMGIKTGWTENARENLVTYIEKDGSKLITVVLSSSDRFGDTKVLIDWIYENYSWNEAVSL